MVSMLSLSLKLNAEVKQEATAELWAQRRIGWLASTVGGFWLDGGMREEERERGKEGRRGGGTGSDTGTDQRRAAAAASFQGPWKGLWP